VKFLLLKTLGVKIVSNSCCELRTAERKWEGCGRKRAGEEIAGVAIWTRLWIPQRQGTGGPPAGSCPNGAPDTLQGQMGELTAVPLSFLFSILKTLS
jgi:hypothetical protein